MDEAFLTQIRAKAQEGIANRLFKEGNETDSLLRAFGSEVAAKTGAAPIYGPLKARAGRATDKVRDDYGGDWYELKDVVRMTFVASTSEMLRQVQMAIRSGAVASEFRGMIKDVETFSHIDPCGYSGLNFVVGLKNGRPAEIQANIPEIMYGKMSENSFTSNLGADLFAQLRARFQLEGGHGHALYEIYRVNPFSVAAKHAAFVSKAYYAHFRERPTMERNELQLELDGLKQAHPRLFH